MHDYRVEFTEDGTDQGARMSLPVPDIATALVVADINIPGGSAELWDGKKLIAHLQKHHQAQSSYWIVY